MTYSFDKLLSWYFSKNSLPYWCIFLLDTIILFLSGVLSYWVFQKTGALVANHVAVLCTMLVYTFVGCFFFRLFRTYSGIVRYSSFIDLMHVANGNFCALLVALGYAVLMKSLDVRLFAALTLTQTVITFILATIVMWGMRILVKTLYDVAFSDKRAMRVLIYGALSGGIGLAKNIGSQHPRKFILRGFISHDERAKHIQLMGRRVYNVNDDLEAIIKRENVQAILVSPMRAKEFRENTALQDMLIKVNASSDYTKFMKHRYLQMSNGVELVGDTTLTARLYARQLCGQYSKDKLSAVADLIDSTEDRLIIFYNFTAEMEMLRKICGDEHQPSAPHGDRLQHVPS